MTANLKLLRKILKKLYALVRLISVGCLWFFPLMLFSIIALVISKWSLWWLVLAAALGTLQMLLMCIGGAYIGASYVQKEWLTVWNHYEARWSESGLLMSRVMEGIYHMIDFIYQEQVKKKAAFEVMMKDLGVDTNGIAIPEGMEDFCKTAKF